MQTPFPAWFAILIAIPIALIFSAIGVIVGWWTGRSYGYMESENHHRAAAEKRITASKIVPHAESAREQLVAYVAKHPIRRHRPRRIA